MNGTRGLAAVALIVVLSLFSAKMGEVFAISAFGSILIFGAIVALISRLAEPRREEWFRRFHTGLAGGAWVCFLVMIASSSIPKELFLAVAIVGGATFLLNQESNEFTDTLFVALVALTAFLGLAVFPEDPFTIPVSAGAAVFLLGAFVRLDSHRLNRLGAPEPGAACRQLNFAWVLGTALFVGLLCAVLLPPQSRARRGAAGPREGDGSAKSEIAVTGLSDSLELGSFHKLKKSDSLVMEARVREIDGPIYTHEPSERTRHPDLLFRAFVLDRCTGRGFRRSRSPAKADPKPRRHDLDQVLLGQQMRLASAPALPANLAPAYRAVASCDLDLRGGVLLRSDAVPQDFALISRVLTPAGRIGLRRYRCRHPEERFLQLPRMMDPRIEGLARQLVRRSENSYDRIRAIERFFRGERRFRYTRIDDNRREAPLVSFLFETRAGHCEYYAAAMCVLLRTIDIPSRVVTGYRGGTYSGTRRAYRILQKNAHAWVEAHFDGVGWVSFDPTPAETRIDLDQGDASPVSARTNAPVIAPKKPDSVLDSISNEQLLSGLGVLAGLGLLGVLLFLVARSRGVVTRSNNQRRSTESTLLRRLDRCLARAGAQASRGLTFRDRLHAAPRLEEGQRERLSPLVELLYRARFGDRPLSASERTEARACLAGIESELDS